MIVFCLLSCLGAQRRAPQQERNGEFLFAKKSIGKKESSEHMNFGGQNTCWWTKSCTTKDGDYPIIYRVFDHPRWCRISSINSTKDVWIATCFFWGSTLIGGPGLFLSWHWSRGSVIRCKVWMPRGWVFFTKDGLTWHLSGEKKRF